MTKPIERPILFSGEMVRALLEGRKMQTRRIIKPQPDIADPELEKVLPAAWEDGFIDVECPYGIIGDRLWVRETFCEFLDDYIYKADEKLPPYHKWKPSIHMPRTACRIALEITGVRIERLQDISEDDALAEGIFKSTYDNYFHSTLHPVKGTYQCWVSARQAFEMLWKSINGVNSWEENPWVWVIEFRRVPHDQD